MRCVPLLLLLISGAGCTPGPDDFVDHTVPSLATQADYEALAAGSNGVQVWVKSRRSNTSR